MSKVEASTKLQRPNEPATESQWRRHGDGFMYFLHCGSSQLKWKASFSARPVFHSVQTHWPNCYCAHANQMLLRWMESWIHKWTICLPMTWCALLQRGPNWFKMCQGLLKVSLRNGSVIFSSGSEAINKPEWRLLCLTVTIMRDTAHLKQQRWAFYIVTWANRSGTRGS